MATIAEEEKKKRGSYGDAAAATKSPSVVRVDAPRLGMSPDPMVNQTAMYVAGAQAANQQPPAAPRPAPIATPAALDPGAMVGKPADFTNRIQPPTLQPAAPVESQPVGGAAFGVPPSMGRRPAVPPAAAPAPAAPVPLEQRLGWRTEAVMNGAAEDASAAFSKGNYGETAGALVRGAATAIPTAVVDFGEGLAGGIAPAAKGFWSGLTGGQSPAPAAPIAPAATPQAPAGTAQGNPNARTDAQRAGVAAPAQSTAPDGSPLVTDAPTGIRRIDAPGKSPLFTNVGNADNAALMARGTNVSGQNQGAAQALSAQYAGAGISNQAQPLADDAQAEGFKPAQIRHSGNDWQARNDLRNLETGASSITNSPKWGGWGGRNGASPAVTAYNEAVKTDQALKGGNDPATISANRDGAFMDRTQAAERAANTRFGMTNKLATQKADAEQTKLGFEAQAAAQVQAASAALMNAKTPAERQTAMETLAGLQGKYSPKEPANRFTVVPGGQAIDEKTGMPYTVPARALDNQTGAFVELGQAAAREAPSPESIAKLKANPALAKQFADRFGPEALAAAQK